MRVSDVMTRGVEWITPETNIQEAAEKMKSFDIGMLPVCEHDRLVGMLTDRDITVRATARGDDPATVLARDVMTPDVTYCFEDQLIEEAAMLMQEKQVRRLVVLDHDKHLIGIVSLGDLAVESDDDGLAGTTLEAVCEHSPSSGEEDRS